MLNAKKFFVVIFSHLLLFCFAYVYVSFGGEFFQLFKKKLMQMPKPNRFLAIIKFSEYFAFFFFFALTNTQFFLFHHQLCSFAFILLLV